MAKLALRSSRPEAPVPDVCPVLSSLYKSERPQAFLVRNVHLAPVILFCCPEDHKSMLAENWTARAAEQTSTQVQQPAAFNPAAPEYHELAHRISQSAAMQRWNELTIQAKQLQKQLLGLTGDAKEAKQQQLEEAQQQLADSQATLSDLQASFEQDSLSLVPWMSAMFALADGGCSTFDAGGSGWPPPPQLAALEAILGPSGAAAAVGGPAAASTWLYGGAERVLGAFKRRYEEERGIGRLTIFTRLALHCFGEESPAELAAAVEGAVERSRQAILGPEAAAAGAALDLVQLHWMDFKERDFLPVLLELARLARPKYQPADDGSGAMLLLEQPRVAAIGLAEPPTDAVILALRAGVPLACVSVTYNLLDVSAAPLLQLCRARGIKVFAGAALAHGLICEAFLGVVQPSPTALAVEGGKPGSAAAGAADGNGEKTAVEALGPDNLAAGLSMVARYGGWARFQQLLHCVKSVAEKHSVSMEAVALRWLIDQGTFPVAAARWSAAGGPWATFGHPYGLAYKQAGAATAIDPSMSAGTDIPAADGVQATGKANVGSAALPRGCVPGIDAALFQVASFLDEEDVAALSSLCGAAV